RAFAAMGFRCLYINPHLGREFETTRLFDPRHRLSHLEENIFELHIRLPREPVYHERMFTAAESSIVAAAIRSVLPARAKCVQMVSFPLWTGVAGRFRDQDGFPVIYDCHDLLSGFRNIGGDILTAETDLFRMADLVLFSSQGLANRFARSCGGRWMLVRNAVS